MSFFSDLADYEFMRNALAAGVLVAVICATIGVYLVLRQMSLLGDGLAHLSFGGVAIGLAAGFLPFWSGLVAAILGAIAIHVLRVKGLLKGDAAIGILFTAGLATGILVVSRTQGLVNAHSYLFGSLLAIPRSDLWVIAGVGAALLVLLALFHREFFYMTFSEEAAKVSGLPVGFLNVLFMSLTAAAIVSAARVTGVLLVSALIVVPASTALQLRRSFATTIALSILLGVASVVGGLAASVEYGTAPGATIAIVSIALFALGALARSVAATRSSAG